MNTFKLLTATASSLIVIGAASVAFAQTPSSNTTSTGTNQYQNPDRAATTGNTTSGNTNTTTQRQTGSSTGTDSTDTTSNRMGRSTDDSMRNTADGSTMRSERVARADRN